MNFLAHLLLSEPAPEFIVGSLAADFLDEKWRTENPEVLAGMARHQDIDRLTDEHPLHRRSRDHIRRSFRHARGVLVDIIYDHLLAVHWRRFSAEPLDGFTARMHAVLQAHIRLAPPIMQVVLPRLIEGNWLLSYRTLDGVRDTLVRLNVRVNGRIDFLPAMDDLLSQQARFEEEFLEFFPQLQARVSTTTAQAR
jgi:acyl carrier protein phosphodiesterase